MESVTTFLCLHAPQAHYVLFILIVLAGLNLPFSEDVLVMIGGILVSTCAPTHYWLMFVWLYVAAILSAYIAYWLGRTLGPKLYELAFFHRVITPERVHRIGHWLEKYGIMTFMVGRFMPLGLRNCLFMTCGLWRMPFPRFMLRDGIGALFATYVLFNIGHSFGENYHMLFKYFRSYEELFLGIIVVLGACFVALICYRRWAKSCI